MQITLSDLCSQQQRIMEKLDQLTAIQRHVAEERPEPLRNVWDPTSEHLC